MSDTVVVVLVVVGVLVVAAAILGVVHAFPGSHIWAGSVELRAPVRLRERLDEAATAVLDSARMLEAAGQ